MLPGRDPKTKWPRNCRRTEGAASGGEISARFISFNTDTILSIIHLQWISHPYSINNAMLILNTTIVGAKWSKIQMYCFIPSWTHGFWVWGLFNLGVWDDENFCSTFTGPQKDSFGSLDDHYLTGQEGVPADDVVRKLSDGIDLVAQQTRLFFPESKPHFHPFSLEKNRGFPVDVFPFHFHIRVWRFLSTCRGFGDPTFKHPDPIVWSWVSKWPEEDWKIGR